MTDDLVKRYRNSREWLNDGECCGDKDSDGICAAPACIFGEAVKEFQNAADRIEKLEAALQNLVDAQGDDECWRDHHGYCQAHYLEEDCCVAEARKALEGKDGN
jgi:hypothetical protein